ncbi:MAG: hypothetical protein LBF15_02180 [Candidatus Peribacteria bacterium]|jgi:hypothetical protein|nr:hypothetical protein [Candidatus Peribacteria bacterium]
MDWPYTYSVTTPNRTEYQIALTLENSNLPMALVGGDYESVARTVLPTIVVATGSINVVGNQRYFIFNEQSSNLPYTFSTPRAPRATREEGDGPPTNFYQSSHFWSCDEIKAA